MEKAEQQSRRMQQFALHNDTEGARKLIQSEDWIQGTELSRALGYACRYGSAEMAQLLLDAGATFEYKRTPWMREVNGITHDAPVDGVIERYLYFLAPSDLRSAMSLLQRQDRQSPRLMGKKYRDVLRLVAERSSDAQMDLSTLLFFALLFGDKQAEEVLRELGITQLRGHLRLLASDGVSGTLQKADQGYAYAIADAALHSKDPESILAAFAEAAGGPARFRLSSLEGLPVIEETMFALVAYTTLPQHMPKEALLRHAVSQSFVRVLQWAVDHGWIRSWGAYDKLQKFAQEAGASEEIRALLLEKQRGSGLSQPKQAGLDVNPFSAKALAAAWTTEDWLGGSLQILSYKGHTSPDVVVPESIGGHRICRIEQSAFWPQHGRNTQIIKARKEISSIVIPGTVPIIPSRMLSNSANLRRVQLGEGVQRIEESAFQHCTALEEVVLPSSVKHIGTEAFACCTSLKSVSGLAPDAKVERGAFRDTAFAPDPDTGLIRLGIENRIVGAAWRTDLDMLELSGESELADCLPHFPDVPPIVLIRGSRDVPEITPDLSDVREGSSVYLGRFPDDLTLQLKPIPWICLERSEDRALLVTQYIIAAMPNSWVNVPKWHNTRLARWLNGAFVKFAFTDLERRRIRAGLRAAGKHEKLDETAVSLLSEQEVQRYFPRPQDRVWTPTEYARHQYRVDDGWSNGQLVWATRTYETLQMPTSRRVQAFRANGYALPVYCRKENQTWIDSFDRAIGLRPAVWYKL